MREKGGWHTAMNYCKGKHDYFVFRNLIRPSTSHAACSLDLITQVNYARCLWHKVVTNVQHYYTHYQLVAQDAQLLSTFLISHDGILCMHGSTLFTRVHL